MEITKNDHFAITRWETHNGAPHLLDSLLFDDIVQGRISDD
jgi:hypothetical protein